MARLRQAEEVDAIPAKDLAPTLNAVLEIANQIVEANIKKGWEKQ